MRMSLLAAPALAMVLVVCGCSKTTTPDERTASPPKVTVSAWVRLAARPDLPASGYFDATAEGEVGPLDSVSAGDARVEMHESMMSGQMSSMKPIGPAPFENGRLTFAPGSKHLMLYGLPAALKPGGTLPLRFRFRGLPITVQANLVGPGDPEPGEWRLAR